ncbi:MAG: hypothetical protein Q3M24_15995 [Candidatus Electrothrix aestuarii]|uniref:Uncharacterized protein n=1 Tax=Candidatus Electrothrix aestuarii TaxID=3062594 RepID=A0AAU8M1T6_9BACT
MNPVSSLTPAVLSGELSSLWIYLTAPVLGTYLVHPTCRWIQGPVCCEQGEEGDCPTLDEPL